RAYCEWAFKGPRQPQRIFFISRGNREACRPALDGVIPESAGRLLPNGLDLEHFRPDPALRAHFRREHGLTSERVVGVAWALRPLKQLEHLFEAVSRLADPSVRVLLAGSPVPGDEAYAATLLQGARQKLGNRFLYLGHLSELRG